MMVRATAEEPLPARVIDAIETLISQITRGRRVSAAVPRAERSKSLVCLKIGALAPVGALLGST
jgi:hypothetical protein